MAEHRHSENIKDQMTINGLLNEYIKRQKNPDGKKFHSLIRAAMRKLCDPPLTIPALAKRLGMQEFQLKMTIDENEQRKQMNRDLIIAICAAVGLDRENIDRGLKMYQFIPLNDSDPREKVIIRALHDFDRNDCSNHLPAIQNALRKNKKKVLQITKKNKIEAEPLAEEIKINDIAEVISEHVYGGEFAPLNGINDRFWPSDYGAEAVAIMRKKGEQTQYRLEYEGDFMIMGGRFEGFRKNFTAPEDCPIPEFAEECRRLRALANERYDKVHAIADDTKNYGIRCDCSYADGTLKIFAETFDFEDPECGWYYQMTKHGAAYVMSITEKSIFLRKHAPDEYAKFYSEETERPILFEFASHHDISQCQKTNEETFSDYRAARVHNMYEYLKQYINNTVQDIRTGKKYIYDISNTDDYYYQPAEYYGMEDRFHFEQVQDTPDSYPEYVPSNRITLLKLQNKKIIISVDDLRKAYALGIPRNKLKNVLERYGSIDASIV